MLANSGEPDQTPRFAASDLVLHCLPMSHKKDTRPLWVKITLCKQLVETLGLHCLSMSHNNDAIFICVKEQF